MFDIYFALIAKLKDKLNVSSDLERRNIREDIKRIGDKLKKQSQTHDEMLDAAFCYYISGYYVQAQNLAKGITISNNSHIIQRWIFEFFAKDFKKLNEELYEFRENTKYQDSVIQHEIESNGLSTSDVIERIIIAKATEGLLDVISFIQIGDDKKISHAHEVFLSCQKLLFSVGEWKIWWWIECLRLITQEYVENSLWHLLKPLQDNIISTDIIKKYIVAHYQSKAVIELWRSQVESLPKINDVERCSFCISVPTSGGKTLVAELAILRFLLDYKDQPESKCVYIAPFRKLAFEVESALSNDFGFLGLGLSSMFYGGNEIDIFDSRELGKARILVVTPEKLDSMLRHYPQLLSQIKLVVADEGHMIGDQNLRGYKYRFLLERLIYKLRIRRNSTNEKPRIVLISGVLPNVEDFADLISGNRTNIIKVDWRPLDEPIIGSLDWTGTELRTSDPSITLPIAFDTNCKSANGFEEIVARIALSFAYVHPTMVFSASKRAITNSSLLDFLECVARNHQLFGTKPLPNKLPRLADFQQYYLLLEKGIAIHHAELPRELRKEMESRIDDGRIRLLFASPTLANGVNIPFHSVLVYRLHHHHGAPIHPATFWNVVGRVGRPIKNKISWNNLEPPSVLFFLNKSWKSKNGDQLDIRLSVDLRKKRAQYQITAPFLKFLQQIRIKWNEMSGNSISKLVTNLAEKDNLRDALGEKVYKKLESIDKTPLDDFLKTLDEHICALLVENEVDEDRSAEWLQQSASDLVDLLVKVSEIDAPYLDDIRNLVLARVRFNIQHLSSSKRTQNYLLGLPANDCEEIKKNEEILLEWYQSSVGMFAQDFDKGLNSLINILNFTATLSICKKWQIKRKLSNNGQLTFDFEIPDRKSLAQNQMFRDWLNGEEISNLGNSIRQFLPTVNINSYVEGMFENNLSWGVSAICRYLKFAAEQKNIPISKDLDYLSTFVKYGVNSKVACHLIRLRISRTDAVRIGENYKGKLQFINVDDEELPSVDSDFDEAIKALTLLNNIDLKNMKFEKETLQHIAKITQQYVKDISNSEPEFPTEIDSVETHR